MPEGSLDANTVLDEDNTRFWPNKRRDHGRVIADIRQRLGRDEDVVPVSVDLRGGADGWIGRGGVEGVVAEAVRL